MLRMKTGRNAKKKRWTATAPLALLLGAAFLAAAPAGALSLSGWGTGQAEALWGAYSGLAQPEGRVEQELAGSARTAAEAAASVEATPPPPPDPQPFVDLAMEAKARAEAQANALLAQRENVAAAGRAAWGLYGSGDGSYDVVLGGAYTGGLEGTFLAHGEKQVSQRVDGRGHEAAANAAAAKAEGALNGAIATLEGLYNRLHASLYLGLDGFAKAVGSVGMDIAGLFGFHQAADIVNTDQLHLGQQVDVAGPALAFPRADLPDVRIPSVAVEQGGEVAADAAATAEDAIEN